MDDLIVCADGTVVEDWNFSRDPEYQHPIYHPIRVVKHGSQEWCYIMTDLTGEVHEYDPEYDDGKQ